MFLRNWHKLRVDSLERENVLLVRKVRVRERRLRFALQKLENQVASEQYKFQLFEQKSTTLSTALVESERSLCRTASLVASPLVYSAIRIRPTDDNSKIGLRPGPSRSGSGMSGLQLESRTGSRVYQFDYVFDQKVTNADLTQSVAHHSVPAVLSGQSLCIAATGQSGSGKSFTMFEGIDSIVPGVSHVIFKMSSRRRLIHGTFNIRCSVTEIYMEKVDVLVSESVMTEHAQFMQMLENVARLRKQRQTAKNPVSSRSHVIIRMNISQQMDRTMKSSQLVFVDLAGSESLPTDSDRDAILELELKGINKGRDAFGNCVRQYRVCQVAPYRESEVS